MVESATACRPGRGKQRDCAEDVGGGVWVLSEWALEGPGQSGQGDSQGPSLMPCLPGLCVCGPEPTAQGLLRRGGDRSLGPAPRAST